MGTTTLIAIPYAGGTANAIYSKWGHILGNGINLVPLEYAGHGTRMAEPMLRDMASTVEDLMRRIRPIATGGPYAIYGHSMGCSVVYEILKAIEAEGLPSATNVFLSGRRPPHIAAKTNYHQLSDNEFLQEIKKIGGTPQAFFEMPELIKLYLPVLRNDYRIVEQYRMAETKHVTTADITFFYSDLDDLVDIKNVRLWQNYTSGEFNLYQYQGGHFFINHCYPDICDKIRMKVAAGVRQLEKVC